MLEGKFTKNRFMMKMPKADAFVQCVALKDLVMLIPHERLMAIISNKGSRGPCRMILLKNPQY